ncbi:MAG: outer rane efflux protein [Acidobacteriales bacterium]|nr:outer rane efflux protein [Terriglobales bacterium]
MFRVRFVGLGLLAFSLAHTAAAQNGAGQSPAATQSNAVASQTGNPSTVPLTLQDTIERALRTNLSVFLTNQATASARGQRLRVLSQLLPNISSGVIETRQQENLETFGIKVPGLPSVVGPFSYFDARVSLSQSLFDLAKIDRARASNQDVFAAQFSYQDARNVIVTAVASGYLRALSDASRIIAAQAQVDTARALYNKAVDLHNAGLSPAIDSVRAQVELQARQQQLIVAKNAYSKDLLSIARAIGLPLQQGQNIELTEKIPYAPLENVTLDQAIERAAVTRSDLKSIAARLRSAELNRKAASAQRLPSFSADADYGATGITPGSSVSTFHVTGAIRMPIFLGGRIEGDVLQADAALQQLRAQLNDLRAQAEFEVRSAFLDLNSAADQVRVTMSTVDLARQALTQSQDRFASGVADNLEVVQAQEAFANANENYIASLFSYNVSKLGLARALGVAETEGRAFVEGK